MIPDGIALALFSFFSGAEIGFAVQRASVRVCVLRLKERWDVMERANFCCKKRREGLCGYRV
jgi:hypothetical protein